MEHIVFLDADAQVLEKLVTGEKTMIVRGGAGRTVPFDQVKAGDVLYFIQADKPDLVRARAVAKEVIQTPRLEGDDARRLLMLHQNELMLSPSQVARWENRRYLVLVSIYHLEIVEPFRLRLEAGFDVDDWIGVEDIQAMR